VFFVVYRMLYAEMLPFTVAVRFAGALRIDIAVPGGIDW